MNHAEKTMGVFKGGYIPGTKQKMETCQPSHDGSATYIVIQMELFFFFLLYPAIIGVIVEVSVLVLHFVRITFLNPVISEGLFRRISMKKCKIKI